MMNLVLSVSSPDFPRLLKKLKRDIMSFIYLKNLKVDVWITAWFSFYLSHLGTTQQIMCYYVLFNSTITLTGSFSSVNDCVLVFHVSFFSSMSLPPLSPCHFIEKFPENSHAGGEVKGLGRRIEDRRDERKLSQADDKTPPVRGWRNLQLTTPLATPEWAFEIELYAIWKNCCPFHPIKSAILSTIPTASV